MRKTSRNLRWSAISLVLLLARPALGDAAGEGAAAGRGEDTRASSSYAVAVGNRLLIGLNSVLTGPADPVASTLDPLEEFRELPGGAVSQYFVGLGQGILLGAYRISMGALDLLFSPVTPMVMLSPEPRYLLFQGAQHEDSREPPAMEVP
ncbi:MAG TPA: hypothetical protein VIY27_06905 [Myxococcota bacterium]